MKKFIKWIIYIIIFLLLVILLVFITVDLETRGFIWDKAAEIPKAQAAVILGAAIKRDGSLSPILEDRVKAAILLYKAGKVEKILVTGDNSSLGYNEVNPVRKYLLQNDIPDKDIFLDHAGFDTYSSMYRAKEIFLAESIIVVTQSFHLPRSVFIARSLGIDATGFNADNGHYKFQNYLREMLANVKAVINLFFEREPKFLGKEIPLSGDGRDNE